LLLAAAIAAIFARERSAAAGRPDFVLVTIDTMRADAFGEDTPFLAELASRGVRFLRCRTPVPLTLPSCTSLLTGLLPARHGIRDNTSPPLPPRAVRRYATLAERLAEAGYATAAFVAANVLDPRYGLDAGFHRYDHPPPPIPGDPRYLERPAPDQTDRARAWLATRPKERPFFLWIHYFDPHDPYLPFDGDERRPATDASDPAPERYRGEVRRVDAELERLFADLDLARTVVVVAADHGEALGEHGEATHGLLCYGCTMNVPLLIAGAGVPAAREDARPRSLVDIQPTVLRLAGLAPGDGDGADLLEEPRGPRVVCGESLYGYRLYGWAQQTCAFDGAATLVDGGPRRGLFDLARDPGETAPLADAEAHEAFERLDRALLAYRALRPGIGPAGEALPSLPPYGSARRPESDFVDVARNRTLPDAEARQATLAALFALRAAIAERDAARVLAAFAPVEALAVAEPENPAPPLELGRALLLVLARPAEAAARFDEAWARGYRVPDVLRLRVEARIAAGDREGARGAVEEAGDAVPPEVRSELARRAG